MRINQIRDGKVDVTLDADELIAVGNLLYEQAKKEPLKPKIHDFAAEIITAQNLCQYGHLDSFASVNILEHKLKAEKMSSKRTEKLQQLLSCLMEDREE